MKKYLGISLLIFFVMAINIITVSAQDREMTSPDILLERSELSVEDQEEYSRQLKYKVTEFDHSICDQKWVQNIDVSQNEMIALAFNNQSIVITDKDFQNPVVISFYSPGAYYVNWNGENVELFLIRPYLLYTFSADGELIEVSRVKSDAPNTRKVTNRKEDVVNGNTYRLTRSGPLMRFAGAQYDMLVKTDALGNEKVLFQSENNTPVGYIGGFAIFVAGQIFFAILIPVGIIKKRREGPSPEDIRNANQYAEAYKGVKSIFQKNTKDDSAP